MTIESVFAAFIVACRADGLAAKTISWYGTMLKPMCEHFSGRDVRTITAQELREYIVSLSERETRYGLQRPVAAGGLSDETVKSHKRAILRFWAWAADEYEFADPARRIKHPGKSKGKPNAGIARDDMAKMINAVVREDMGIRPINRIRDTAIVFMLADTAARAAGLLSMNIKDVFLDTRTAIVEEKGDKLRRVHFLPITGLALSRWLAVRPDDESHRLFLAIKNGTETSAGPLSYTGLYEILKRLARRAGVQGRFNPHSFRHGFAREYLQSGGDLATLAQLMGHSSVTTTADAYAQFERSGLTEQHDKHSPIRKLPLK